MTEDSTLMNDRESTERMASAASAGELREVPVDWEALEDAFENNAPEVHSYLHLATGEVLRVVDGVADPQMHVRISSDSNYLRIDPVSSREQYRWMERFIPMVEDPDLRGKLAHSIDGKGAFRRFKDVLMTYGPERERWFTFRSERLRTFMEAWLAAHAIKAAPRPAWADSQAPESEYMPESVFGSPVGPSPGQVTPLGAAPSITSGTSGAAVPGISTLGGLASSELEGPKSQAGRRARNAEATRQQMREILDALGPRELDTLLSFAEFLKARRAARGFAHHHEHQLAEREAPVVSQRGFQVAASTEALVAGNANAAEDKGDT